MNNQFATQHLLQEMDVYDSLRSALSELGATEDSINVLVKAVEMGALKPSEAIEIVKKAMNIHEDGAAAAPAAGGGSSVGGGVTNGATFTAGTGEQTATTKAFKGTRKKKYQEDFSEEEPLEIGDRVKVVYGNQFYGHTGTVEDIRRGFVIVDVDGEGSYSMHISDVEKIDGDLDEDAPRLAGNPAKTTKQGARNLSAYSSVGFTKAPNAKEAGKHIKGVDVEELWEALAEDFKHSDKVEIVNGADKGRKAVVIRYATSQSGETVYLVRFVDGGVAEIPGQNLKLLSGTEISESRKYNQFKKEAATRSKDQQMHEAVRMIHSRLAEVSKLLEYAQQMRAELSEGEQTLEYNHNTKKVFERINSKVVEIYSKTRQLK